MPTLSKGVLILLVLAALNTTAVCDIVRSHNGPCPAGSVIDKWISDIRYNDQGHPVSASGIDCNGKAWSKSFASFFSGNQPVGIPTTFITEANLESIFVESDQSVDLRIISLADGEWQTGLISGIAANVPFEINTAGLAGGVLYGIVVVFNDYPVELLTFYQ